MAAVVLALFLVVRAVLEEEDIPKLLFEQGSMHFRIALGKTMAIMAASLVLFQFVLSSRLKPLDRIFSLNRLFKGHKGLALVIVCLAAAHPLLLFTTPEYDILPLAPLGPWLEKKWAVIPGALVLATVLGGAAAGFFRERIGLPFQLWRRMHGLGMFSATALLFIHVYFIGHDIHHSATLLGGYFAVLAAYLALFAWTRIIRPLREKLGAYVVEDIQEVGARTRAITLKPPEGRVRPHLPGQFAFLRFYSDKLGAEEHPFTISSPSTRPKSHVFTIKESGDFTDGLGRLEKGDKAAVDGPWGLFSHLAWTGENQELVFIAGGVGITPMLSMLRHMADRDDARTITLIWSNRTEEDILCREEIENMAEQLPGLSVTHVLTRQKDWDGPTGHLDTKILRGQLEGVSPRTPVFLCGPPPMMDAVGASLLELGWSPADIHTERFSL